MQCEEVEGRETRGGGGESRRGGQEGEEEEEMEEVVVILVIMALRLRLRLSGQSIYSKGIADHSWPWLFFLLYSRNN